MADTLKFLLKLAVCGCAVFALGSLIRDIVRNFIRLKKIKAVRADSSAFSVEATVSDVSKFVQGNANTMQNKLIYANLSYEVNGREYKKLFEFYNTSVRLENGAKLTLITTQDDPEAAVMTEDYEERSLKKSTQMDIAYITITLIFVTVAFFVFFN